MSQPNAGYNKKNKILSVYIKSTINKESLFCYKVLSALNLLRKSELNLL
jgi:hypothetical protein